MAFKVAGKSPAPPASSKPAPRVPSGLSATADGTRRPFSLSSSPVKQTSAASSPQPIATKSFHGRTKPLPPRGLGYYDYVEWASDGGLPTEEDHAVALDLYMGIREDDDLPSPRM